MVPILTCLVIAVVIVIERFWTLRQRCVLPRDLTSKVRGWIHKNELDPQHIRALHQDSPLGKILAAGLNNRNRGYEYVKEAIEDTGRHVVHELERFLSPLGTIAAITPLLGLLGTVIGMVKVFAAITVNGVGDPTVLAGGISEALVTTAAGLSVAIPSLICYRYLRAHIDALVVQMEKESISFIQALHTDTVKADT